MPRRVSTSSSANASPTSANAAAVFGAIGSADRAAALRSKSSRNRSWSGPKSQPARYPHACQADQQHDDRAGDAGGAAAGRHHLRRLHPERHAGQQEGQGRPPGFMAVRPGIRLLRTATSNVHPASTRTPPRIAAAPAARATDEGPVRLRGPRVMLIARSDQSRRQPSQARSASGMNSRKRAARRARRPLFDYHNHLSHSPPIPVGRLHVRQHRVRLCGISHPQGRERAASTRSWDEWGHPQSQGRMGPPTISGGRMGPPTISGTNGATHNLRCSHMCGPSDLPRSSPISAMGRQEALG